MLSRAAARACPASARVLRHSVRAMASSGEPIGRSRAGHSPHLRMAPDADDGMLHNADSQHLEVIKEQHYSSKVLWLNRPKSLNALNMEMLEQFLYWVQQYDENDAARAVFIRGRGDKAFCAGGDVKTLWERGQRDETRHEAVAFFKREYLMNYMLATSNKNFVACLDGITMGGGVGIGCHNKFVVATETSMLAMPECGIGLFPDVGSTHMLPRLPDGMGMYLGLTGQRLTGSQLLFAGIASHAMPNDALDELPQLMGQGGGSFSDRSVALQLDMAADGFHEDSARFAMEDMYWIRWVFGHLDNTRGKADCSVEAITDRLRHLATLSVTGDSPEEEQRCANWAQRCLKAITKGSPVSVKVTHEQLSRGAHMSWEDCFALEFRLAQRFMNGKDFFEGVRATLVDRDNSPQWQFPTLADVPSDVIESYFSPDPRDDTLELPEGRHARPGADMPRSAQANVFRPLTSAEYAHFARRTSDPKLPFRGDKVSDRDHRMEWGIVRRLMAQEVREQIVSGEARTGDADSDRGMTREEQREWENQLNSPESDVERL